MSFSSHQSDPSSPNPDSTNPSSLEHVQLTSDGKRKLPQLERQTKVRCSTLKAEDISNAVHEVSSSGVMYPGTSTLSNPSSTVVSSTPPNHVQETTPIEKALLSLRTHRLAEYQDEVYIAPMAKLNPQAPDADVCPLMDKVLEFLAGKSHVMLILGDSGAG
ncbi:hypothetical protein BGZ90_005805, partial [Linnemannia elongata]